MRLDFLVFALVAGAAGSAQARETRATPPLAAIDCFCTDRSGSRVEFGEIICLSVDGRAFFARCEMSLNVPAWRDIGAECVGAGLAAGARQTSS